MWDFLTPRRRTRPFTWGLTLGAAAALYLAWRAARDGAGDDDGNLDPETVRTIAAGALLADPELRRYRLEVRSIAPGILDVSGTVDSEETAARALKTVRRGRGVRTVLDRIAVADGTVRPEASAADA